MALQISATNPEHPALLLELPWHLPLEEWPEKHLVPLPRGISRHVVRYARAGDEVIAVKELAERPGAARVRAAARPGPARHPRRGPARPWSPAAPTRAATPLEPVLITRHLGGSMPYRSMFETTMRPATMHRLMDALAVLLVRLHLRRVRLGRLLAVQHPLPARRGRVRRVPGGRRDRRSAPAAQHRAARLRPRSGPREHQRRAAGPGGVRGAAPVRGPDRVRQRDLRPLPASCGRS